MPFSGRELVLILRATNQASGPLRQVGRDLRTLGRGGVQSFNQLSAAQQRSIRNWERIGTASAVFRDTARVARLGGIAIGAGLAFAAKSYADFNTQTGLAATQTGNFRSSLGRTTAEVARNADIIEKGILAQMRKYPASAKEMTDATYEIFSSTSLGSQGTVGLAKGLKLLDLANKAAVAGQVDLSEVTKAMTTTMNAFGGGVQKMPQRLQRMFAAVRFGRITFGELLQAMNQLVPAGTAANQTFDEIVGTFSALTRVMPNPRMAATALSRLMEVIGRKAFVTGARKFGMEITDSMGRLKPLSQIVLEFNKAVQRAPEKERANLIRNFFKEVSKLGEGTKSGFEATIQARRALVHLMRSYGLYSTVLGQVRGDNTEFTKSFQIMAQRAGVQWATFMNRMRAAWLAVGAAAIPILMQLLDPIRELAEAFSNLDDEQRSQIVRWTAIAAAVLIVGGTLVKIASSIMVVVSGFKAAGGSISLLLARFAVLTAAILLLTGQGDLLKGAFQGVFESITSSVLGTVAALTTLFLLISRFQMAGGLAAILPVGGVAGRRATQMRAVGAGMRDVTMAGRAAAAQGGIARAAWAATVQSVLLLPGPLKVAAIATAGIAGAAYLINRHMDAASKRADMLAERQRMFRAEISRPLVEARRVGEFGVDVRQAERSQLAVQELNARIRDTRRAIQEANAAERPDLQRQLRGLYLDRADAMDQLRAANQQANESFRALERFIPAQVSNFERLATIQQRIAALTQRRRQLEEFIARPQRVAPRLQIQELEKVNRLLQGARGNFNQLRQTINVSAVELRSKFIKAMTDLSRAKIVPTAPRQVLADMLNVFIQLRRRLPTLAEARIFIKAALDPSSAGALDGDIRKMLSRIQRQRQLKIDLARGREFAIDTGQIKKQAKDVQKVKLPPAVMGSSLLAPKNTKKVKKDVQAVFKTPIKQPINLGPVSPPAAALGASIAAGIASGVTANAPTINSAVIGAVNNAIAAGVAAAKAGSPSRETEQKIGLPLAQGVASGIRKGIPDILLASTQLVELFTGKIISDFQAASLTINFFSSKFLQDLEENIQEAKDKLSDARKTNDAEARKFIGRKITPAALIRDMQIQAEQLNMFVNNMARLARRGVPRQLINQLRELGQEGAEKMRILASATQAELNRFVAAWRRAQAAVDRFSRVTAQQLIQSLRATGNEMKRMNNDLVKLAARGVPAIIIAQLAAMGPEAAAHIRTLVGMSRAELRKWVAAWYAAQREVLRAADLASYPEILERNRQFMRELFDPTELVQKAKSAGEEIASAFTSAFGTLFSDAIRQRVGQAFADALSGWESEMAGLQRELSDAYNELEKENASYQKELAEAQAAAVRERAEELQQQFGQLFAGDWLKDKMDWRSVLRMKDLKRDLQEQINAFKDWRQSLATLATRAIPPALLKQLEELGIENRDLIRILAKSTDQELQEYIDLWQQGQTLISDIANTAVADTSEITARHMEAVAGIMGRIADIQARMDALAKTKPQPLTFEDIYADLQKQIDAFQNWTGALQKLRDRNVPAELLNQLRELGPEAYEILLILINATDAQLQEYVALWKRGGLALGDATKTWKQAVSKEEILSGMREALNTWRQWQAELANIQVRISVHGKEVTANLMKYLRELGPEALPYLQALSSMTEAELAEFVSMWEQMQAEITAATEAEWIKNGKALAKGFMQGIAESSPMLAAALGITLTDVGTQAGTAAAPSYYKVGQDISKQIQDGIMFTKPVYIENLRRFLQDTAPILETGIPIWRGLGQSIADSVGSGFSAAWEGWAARIQAAISSVQPPVGVDIGRGLLGAPTGNGGTNVTMNVNAVQDQSLMSTLELATFRLRNRTP